MAFEFLVQPIRARHVILGKIGGRGCKPILAARFRIRGPATYTKSSAIIDEGKVEKQDFGHYGGVDEAKEKLKQALQDLNRGIFDIPSAKKSEIEELSLTILGAKRTKLGLRGLISLGDIYENIDAANRVFVFTGNAEEGGECNFNVGGLNDITGQLTIHSFQIATQKKPCPFLNESLYLQKVDIKYETSSIVPDQLMNMFQKIYDMLLGIFNPQGWLHISYVDESLRIGRDDQGNVFVLESKVMDSFHISSLCAPNQSLSYARKQGAVAVIWHRKRWSSISISVPFNCDLFMQCILVLVAVKNKL
ncbi:hypothetical protein AMTRI_Chr11g94700 [Amborella trichopoda]